MPKAYLKSILDFLIIKKQGKDNFTFWNDLRKCSWEEISSVWGQGWQREELPRVQGQGRQPGGATPCPHAQGQGRRPGGATPRPRSLGCAGAGGPRGAIPRWRSGRVAVRRSPSSKVRSNGCALLEQPWRDTPRLR